MNMTIVGLDVGGANFKSCDSDGRVYFKYHPLWVKKSVKSVLETVKEMYSPDYVGVVITGELSDIFNSKKEGIKQIADEINRVFKETFFYGSDGKFHSRISDPELFFSPNWLASANYLAKFYPDSVFVDVGSTTTDIIPILNGQILAEKNDFDRLKRGELIYVGALRTSLSFLLPAVHLDMPVPTAVEYFSNIADALMVTEDIKEEDYSCETPDGRGKSKEECFRRIARTVCCDLEELGRENAEKIAFQAKNKLVEIIKDGIERIARKYSLKTVIGAGVGEFLIENATEALRLEYISIGSKFGREVSKVFPAFATAKLLQEYLE